MSSHLRVVRSDRPARVPGPITLADFIPIREDELAWARMIAASRPAPLRDFDQIAMHDEDLVRQAKLIAPTLAGKRVVFVGDHDSASLMSAVSTHPDVAPPEHILVVDFDQRVLDAIKRFSESQGLGIETLRYNVFDPVPKELAGTFDIFYTNPPYGQSNSGRSGILFAARGDEFVRREAGHGVVIIPDDPSRPWTRAAMLSMQKTMWKYGWLVGQKINLDHGYHLDDEPTLVSTTLVLERAYECSTPPLTAGINVRPESMPSFYGRSVNPPYPRYIDSDGTQVPFEN